MNKKYIEPSIDVIEFEGDELCLQASDEINNASSMESKDRTPSSTYSHEDLGWDY